MQTGIPELTGYQFSEVWYVEDVLKTVGELDKTAFLEHKLGKEQNKYLLIDNSSGAEVAERKGFGLKIT